MRNIASRRTHSVQAFLQPLDDPALLEKSMAPRLRAVREKGREVVGAVDIETESGEPEDTGRDPSLQGRLEMLEETLLPESDRDRIAWGERDRVGAHVRERGYERDGGAR